MKDAFRIISANGMLSARRMEVYRVLHEHGPLTATEIADRMPGSKSSSVGANVHARLGELRERGVVAEMGTRECPVTGHNVIIWKVTGRLPTEPPKRKTVGVELREARRWASWWKAAAKKGRVVARRRKSAARNEPPPLERFWGT